MSHDTDPDAIYVADFASDGDDVAALRRALAASKATGRRLVVLDRTVHLRGETITVHGPVEFRDVRMHPNT